MASSAELQKASRQYRAEQLLITTVLVRDLLRLVRALFNVDQPEQAWPELRTAIGLLIRDRRTRSAGNAGTYYQRVRELSGLPRLPDYSGLPWPAPARFEAPEVLDVDVPTPRPRTVIRPARELEQERLDAAVDGAGIATYKKALRTGATARQAKDRAATALSGTATRLSLEGGRSVISDTVAADDDVLGWMRLTDADPCSWCAMLASRGAVYKNERTAGRAKNDRFTGEGAFKWHDHCGCVAIAVTSGDDPHLQRAEELYDQWQQATAGHSGKGALNAWRQHWEADRTIDT